MDLLRELMVLGVLLVPFGLLLGDSLEALAFGGRAPVESNRRDPDPGKPRC